MSEKPFTLRQCFWLCLPALVIGLVLRVCFLVSIPESYYGSDSNSYFETADTLRNEGKWDMGPKRRGLYPLFALLNTVLPGSTVQSNALLQHAMGLAAVLGIGWITGHLTQRRRLWVPLMTLVAASLPQPLWYEHEFIADKMLADAVVLAISMALPVSRLKTRNGLFWFLIAAAAVVAVKPHGKPFWLGMLMVAGLMAGNPLRWGLRNYAAVLLAVILMVTSGSSKQSSWLFLSSTLPLLNTSPQQIASNPKYQKWAEYRAALDPLVQRTKNDPINYPWKQGTYKKILNHGEFTDEKGVKVWEGTTWPALLKDNDKFSTVAKGLALEAVKTHPVTFARMVLFKFGIAMTRMAPRTPDGRTPKPDELWNSNEQRFAPWLFWDQQNKENEGRWTKREAQMRLLYGTDKAGYQQLTEARASQPTLLMPEYFDWSQYLNWFTKYQVHGANFPSVRPSAFGYIGFLGMLACFLPTRFRRGSFFLLLPCMLYLIIVYVVGDALQRYIMPVEWFGALFGVMGIDLMLDLATRLVRRGNPDAPEPASTPDPTPSDDPSQATA